MNQFRLKVIWLQKSIGISIDQNIGKVTTPITEFIFWPEKDVLQTLESQLTINSWILEHESSLLVEQIETLRDFWQEKENQEVSRAEIEEKFNSHQFFGL
jgi:hypothetical protein